MLCIWRHVPNGAFVLSFTVQGVIADIITQAKFFVNRFRRLGVLTPPQKKKLLSLQDLRCYTVMWRPLPPSNVRFFEPTAFTSHERSAIFARIASVTNTQIYREINQHICV